jgi:hypothetical protein
MQKETGFNYRQLRLMQQKIIFFNKDKINLKDLIDDLEALFYILEIGDVKWKKTFWLHLDTLEIIYALAASRGEKVIDEKGQKEIQEALDKMSLLIEEQIINNKD